MLIPAVAGFVAGTWTLQQSPSLPDWAWILAGLLFSLAPSFGAIVRPRQNAAIQLTSRSFASRLPGVLLWALLGALSGYAWAAAYAHHRLADRLDPAWEGRDVVLTGVVASLPQPFERGVRFEFAVESSQPADATLPRLISMAWYNGLTPEEYQVVMPVRAGERWRLAARLRLPHGLANPHGFDYEAWLLERGIRATGFVRVRGDSERLDALAKQPSYLVERLREIIRERFWEKLEAAPYAGILIALAIGDQRAIEALDWQVFARTGVSHLMSISGLHVTMVSGLFAWLVFNIWRRVPWLALRLPAQKAAAVAAVLGALGYCLISGFAVPAQRTLYMVAVVALALWLDRASSGSRVLALALVMVLVIDPWAVLAPGFWLSFGAVGLIFYVSACRPQPRGWMSQWSAVQWAVTLGLAPLTLVIFQQVSLVSPLANALAIPLVSLVVTPLALAGAVLPVDFPLHLAHWLLERLMPFLEWLSALDGAVWVQHAPALWTVPLAMLGACWLLAPRGTPSRLLGVILLLPMFMVAPALPAAGELQLTFVDVGQGMAVVARTRNHVLLYDTGPSWGEQSDSGARVLLPYLRGEGLSSIDMLVVSHDDGDHSGGAASLLQAMPVAQFASALTLDHPLNQRILAPRAYRSVCAADQRWQWDGVQFEFLHPDARLLSNPFLSGNDGSCVLRIETSSGSVLLAGDIERAAESLLQKHAASRLKADVLLVPHHGSGTSSTPEFVGAVAPAHAVFQMGYRNRFGHPRADVLQRYVAQGSAILRSDTDGAVRMLFAQGAISVEKRRESARRYWQGR